MDLLLQGVVKFMEEDFLEHQNLFESLEHNQDPRTLFIACSDSRLSPNLITNTLPGEIFVVRNIANIVPPYRISEDYVSTTSAIEYALHLPSINSIIICGHSNCGGCEALYLNDEELSKMPNVKKWINLMEPIKESLSHINANNQLRAWLTERLNVVNSLQNLLTYPEVLQKYESGKLKIYGWHYIIKTGEIFSYSLNDKHFKIIGERI